MRKEAGFEVTDHINIGYVATGLAADVLANDGGILQDVLADGIQNKQIEGYTKDWNINGDARYCFIPPSNLPYFGPIVLS